MPKVSRFLNMPTLIFLLFMQAKGFADEGQVDARELCRAQMSGNYLGFMNDLDLLKGTLNATSAANFAMKAKRKLTAHELKTLEAHNEAQKIPAAELDEKVLGLRHTLDTADDEIRDTDAQIVTIKDHIAAKEKAFKAFREQIKVVFETVTAKVVNTGAYPVQLQYRHPCSRFQALCPLPDAQAKALLNLSAQLEDKTACSHYAQIRATP
ncbi:MAG: hypothetical protein H7249_01260 [Chitinophagaceae bacterium]|nr:hypothetical protein [Oligoflexus sp.]